MVVVAGASRLADVLREDLRHAGRLDEDEGQGEHVNEAAEQPDHRFYVYHRARLRHYNARSGSHPTELLSYTSTSTRLPESHT